MAKPQFDANGCDNTTYAPFELLDIDPPDNPDYQVRFHDWEWLASAYAADMVDGYIDGYYTNGPNIEGLVRASMLSAGFDLDETRVDYDSEGDACWIRFRRLEDAVQVAEMAANMIKDREKLRAMIQVSKAHGFDDG
jgi:hypothetical protein